MSRSVSSMASLMLATICFALSTFGTPPTAKGDDKDDATKNQPASFWMKKKLDYSQNILAGIANADFDKIAESAQSMQNLSKVEGFIRGQMPFYRSQLEAFQDANAEIIRQAQKDNVEGAALAFTQLTISCVNCHKRLREAK